MRRLLALALLLLLGCPKPAPPAPAPPPPQPAPKAERSYLGKTLSQWGQELQADPTHDTAQALIWFRIDAVPVALPLAKHAFPQVRREAVRVLAEVGRADPAAVDAVIDALEDEDREVRAVAHAGLEDVLEFDSPRAAEAYLKIALGPFDQDARLDATVRISDDQLRPLLPSLSKPIAEGPPKRRKRALELLILRELDLSPLVPAARVALGKDTDHETVSFLAELLVKARARDAETRTLLEGLLLRPSDSTYPLDVAYRVAIQGTDPSPDLLAKLRSSDPKIRERAIELLRLFGPRAAPAAPALTELLRQVDEDQRLAVALTLAAMGEPGLSELEALATSDDPATRRRAVEAFADVGAAGEVPGRKKKKREAAPSAPDDPSEPVDLPPEQLPDDLPPDDLPPDEPVPPLEDELGFPEEPPAEDAPPSPEDLLDTLPGGLDEGGSPEFALPALLRALKDPDPGVREEAARGLGRVIGANGDDHDWEPAVAALARLALEDPRAKVRQSAADALDVRPLIAIERWSKAEGADRARVLEALVFCLWFDPLPGFGDPPPTEQARERARKTLHEALSAKEPRLRAVAAWGLGHLRTDALRAALVKALNDPTWFVRLQALRALEGFEQPIDAKRLRAALKDPEVVVRRHAARLLEEQSAELPPRESWYPAADGRYGDRSAPSWIADLDQEDPTSLAHTVLRVADREPVVPLLMEALETAKELREFLLLDLLAEHGAREAVPALIARSESTDDLLRGQVVRCLGRLADPRGATTVIRLLETDPSELVRYESALALAKIPCKDRVAALTRALGQAYEPLVAAASRGLKDAGVDTVALLGDMAKSEVVSQRESAARASAVSLMLAPEGSRALEKLLIALLADPAPEVRDLALEGVDQLGERGAFALPALVKVFRASEGKRGGDQLAGLGEPGRLALADLVRDPDPDLRLQAELYLDLAKRFGSD